MQLPIETVRTLYAGWGIELSAFVEDILGEHLTAEIPKFHKELYKVLPREKRIAIAAPRGFAKSVICSVFYPLWCALFKKKREICIISASEGLAVDFLRKVRFEVENNRLLEEFFGDFRSPKWTETQVIFKNGVTMRARGAGGQIRGFRPDLVVLDDIETDESVVSKEQRDKLRDWVYKACLNTLLPDGQFIWIGTILSHISLLQEVLSNDNGWYKKLYAAYVGEEKEGNELWAGLWNHGRLQERKKEIGSLAFSAEYMNSPLMSESAAVKEHQIRYWDVLPDHSCVIVLDPAYSDDEHSDYKTAVVVAVDKDMNRYLVEYIRTHAPLGEYERMCMNLWLKYKNVCTAVGVPNQGVEKGFYSSFVRKCEEMRLYPPLMSVKNVFTSATGVAHRNKTARVVAALQPLFEQGKYYIHRTHEEAKDELLSIGYSRWDDLVDPMASAENLISPVFFKTEDLEENAEYNKELVLATDYGMEY